MQIFHNLVLFPFHRSCMNGTKFCNCLLVDVDTRIIGGASLFLPKDRKAKISVKGLNIRRWQNGGQFNKPIACWYYYACTQSNVRTGSFVVMGCSCVMSISCFFEIKQENCIKLIFLWQSNGRNASKSHKLYVITNCNRQ